MRLITPTPTVFQVKLYGRVPVELRPEFQETTPIHADMLRYDSAFHAPQDISIVAFPAWRTSRGNSADVITTDRWRSFGLTLHKLEWEDYPQGILRDDWITYTSELGNLEPVTFAVWKVLRPTYKFRGYRINVGATR